jgi:hypothetical protein
MPRLAIAVALSVAAVFVVPLAAGSAPGPDVRLTNDCLNAAGDPLVDAASVGVLAPCVGGGYVSSYQLAGNRLPDGTIGPTVAPDPVIRECSIARGRQNEPAVGVDPRNTNVVVGSSNDYCGVYAFSASPVGPIWLGYYRSENSGASFQSSLVPGYPQDNTPYAALAGSRTASAGDPVIAWDAEGRVFVGSESSDDPAGTRKSFGDVFVARYENPNGPTGPTLEDGKQFTGSTIVSRGSSAPNLLGVFNDKTAIEADHNSDNRCDNNVYFSYSRFTGGSANNSIYFSRSTDHGRTFSQTMKLNAGSHSSQFPDIAVTGNSDVYVVFRQFEAQGNQPNALVYVRSTDCGATFSAPRTIATFTPYDAQDVSEPEPMPVPQVSLDDPASAEAEGEAPGNARDCGDFSDHCASGYTFFRRDTQVRMTADQFDTAHPDWLYVVYDPTDESTIMPTGTTYGSIESGVGSYSAVYFIRLSGATGSMDGPTQIDPVEGNQLFPDISADTPPLGGAAHQTLLHTIWWDSRLDECKSPMRPIGNCADLTTVASLDAWGARSSDYGASWTAARLSDQSSNPNYEQFGNRQVPFAGDYLYVSSVGEFSYGVWTDWRNTRQGTDLREAPEDEDAATADVYQCRTIETVPATKKTPATKTVSADQCPHAGGLDQNIYGDKTP